MPSAASYTNKIRFAASVKNIKTQYPGGVGNLTQGSIAACGLDIQYTPVDYVELCACNVNPTSVDVPLPPPPPAPSLPLVISTLTYIPLPDIYGVSRSYGGFIYTSVPSLSGIRKVSVDTGTTTILNAGYLDYPQGLEVDSVGNLYIADSGSNLIRRVNLNTGVITTLDVGVLDSPRGVTVDSVGNLYVADTGNNRIKKLNVNTGTVTILPTESLSSPNSVAVDSVGNVYIADTGNDRIQRVNLNTGTVTILDAGPLDNPNDLAVDSSGNLYISDSGNNRIQQFDLNTGTITTTAGTGDNGLNVGVALASNAELGATNISADASGDIYVADVDNRHIRTLYVPQALPPPPPPPAVLPVLTQAQIFALTAIIVGIRNLEGSGGPLFNTYLQDFKNIAGFDYFPEYTLPPYALLTPSQIFALTPILNSIKYLEGEGLGPSNPTFYNLLQNFNTLAGFDYFTGYTLPPYPTIPIDQHVQLRPIVVSLDQITQNSGIVLSTNESYNSYLNQFTTITGYDYYYGFKLPTRFRLDPIVEQLQMDTALNVILPPYDGTPYQFITNNEPIHPYDIPVHGAIPTTVDITNTPATIAQSTPIIKTLKLLPSNINTFEIKARGDFLYVLGTTSGAYTPDSIYKINIVTGSVQTFPLNQPANTNVISFAMDSSDNFYYALNEDLGFSNKFTIYKKLVGTNTFIHIAGTALPIELVYPPPSGTPPIKNNVYNGDNIPATTAQISFGTYGYHVTNLEFYNNNLFFIDFQSQRIRKIDLATNIISTVVGPTTYPIKSYAISSQGDIWFSALVDQPDQTSALQINIFVYSQSTQQTTIFGTLSGILPIAEYLNSIKVFGPSAITLDNNNGLYISSAVHQIVYKVNIQTKKWAIIAGNPNKRLKYQGRVINGYNGDNDNPTNINTLAQISEPLNLAVDDYGSLYIASWQRGLIDIDDGSGTVLSYRAQVPRVVRKVYNARQFVVG